MTVTHTCKLSRRDVHEAINEYLRLKKMPTPGYITDTDKVKWLGVDPDGVSIEWRDDSEAD